MLRNDGIPTRVTQQTATYPTVYCDDENTEIPVASDAVKRASTVSGMDQSTVRRLIAKHQQDLREDDICIGTIVQELLQKESTLVQLTDDYVFLTVPDTVLKQEQEFLEFTGTEHTALKSAYDAEVTEIATVTPDVDEDTLSGTGLVLYTEPPVQSIAGEADSEQHLFNLLESVEFLMNSVGIRKTAAIAYVLVRDSNTDLETSDVRIPVKYHGHGGPWRPCFVSHC